MFVEYGTKIVAIFWLFWEGGVTFWVDPGEVGSKGGGGRGVQEGGIEKPTLLWRHANSNLLRGWPLPYCPPLRRLPPPDAPWRPFFQPWGGRGKGLQVFPPRDLAPTTHRRPFPSKLIRMKSKIKYSRKDEKTIIYDSLNLIFLLFWRHELVEMTFELWQI